MIFCADSLYLHGELTGAGWVQTDGETIVAAGTGTPPAGEKERVAGLLAPGFVDAHSHGGGGASFSTTNAAEIETVIATHAAHGTTAMNASLVTASSDDLRAQVAALAPFVASGELTGVHLEGPWLSPANKGAHAADLLRAPDLDLAAELLDAHPGVIAMVTIAPELPGASALIELLADRGVVAAIGHTVCSYAQARDAIERGARGATHLFNAMPGLHHREPGPLLALMDDDRVHVELIFDGVHVHPDLAAATLRAAGARGVLITDAMGAAGSPDGDYLLGTLPVTVTDGVARLAGQDTIAGSTLTLDAALRNAVAAGVPLADALRALTSAPAAYQRFDHVGTLEAGKRADLVVVDADLRVHHVVRRGEPVAA